jgi:hypothetical protein
MASFYEAIMVLMRNSNLVQSRKIGRSIVRVVGDTRWHELGIRLGGERDDGHDLKKHPFAWTKTPEEVFRRANQKAISGPVH